jgi:hypothetical protein
MEIADHNISVSFGEMRNSKKNTTDVCHAVACVA